MARVQAHKEVVLWRIRKSIAEDYGIIDFSNEVRLLRWKGSQLTLSQAGVRSDSERPMTLQPKKRSSHIERHQGSSPDLSYCPTSVVDPAYFETQQVCISPARQRYRYPHVACIIWDEPEASMMAICWGFGIVPNGASAGPVGSSDLEQWLLTVIWDLDASDARKVVKSREDMESSVKKDCDHANVLHDDARSVALFLLSNRFGLFLGPLHSLVLSRNRQMPSF